MTVISQPFANVVIESATKISGLGSGVTNIVLPSNQPLSCTPNNFDNTFWTPNNDAFWNGQFWDHHGTGTFWELDPLGGWNLNTFRPTSMIINFGLGVFSNVPIAIDVFLDDTDGVLLGNVFNVFTEPNTFVTLEMTLDYSGSAGTAGIGTLTIDPDFYTNDGPEIRCIQFVGG